MVIIKSNRELTRLTTKQLRALISSLAMDIEFYYGDSRGAICPINAKHIDICFGDYDEIMSACDIAVAIGGDGTTLNVAKKASLKNKPVLGINAGRLGFMSGIERDELNLLENLVSDNYKIDERRKI